MKTVANDSRLERDHVKLDSCFEKYGPSSIEKHREIPKFPAHGRIAVNDNYSSRGGEF